MKRILGLIILLLTVTLCFASCEYISEFIGKFSGCKHEDVTVLAAVEPTCTKNGLTEGKKCNECGEIVVEQEKVKSPGHTVVTEPKKDATCTETGLSEGKSCSVCDAVIAKPEIIDKLDHEAVIVAGKAPTSTTTGLTKGRVCSSCSTVILPQRVIPVTKESLSSYNLYSVGDSLCSTGRWQTKIAEITGIKFNQSINNGSLSYAPTSMGGTNSNMSDPSSTYFRTLNLIQHGGIEGEGENALVLFENVNDGQFVFDPSAPSYRMEQIINIDALTENHLASIENSKRNINTALAVNHTAAGKVLKITELPNAEGDITIKVGWDGPGTYNYNIHVTPYMDMSDIMELILEISYVSIYDIEYSYNTVAFTSGIDRYLPKLEFFPGNTGMDVSIEDINNATYQKYYWYNSDDLSGWTEVENWVIPSVSSGWKSAIEALLEAYPKIQIGIVNLPRISATQADYLKSDGTYDEEKYEQDLKAWKDALHNRCGAIADYYDVLFIDCWENVNITASNLTDYYYDTANVHPKYEGYLLFGEVIAAELQKSERLVSAE